MVCFNPLVVFIVGIPFIAVASGLKFVDWLETQTNGELSESAQLAKMHEGIDSVAVDMPNLYLFLPTNLAWKGHEKYIQAFKNDADLRYDMILASGAEVKKTGGNPLESLRLHQKAYNMLDSGYGTPYFVMSDEAKLCSGIWSWNEYSYTADKSKCANLSGSTVLKDLTVFKIDKLLLPTEMTEQLDSKN